MSAANHVEASVRTKCLISTYVKYHMDMGAHIPCSNVGTLHWLVDAALISCHLLLGYYLLEECYNYLIGFIQRNILCVTFSFPAILSTMSNSLSDFPVINQLFSTLPYSSLSPILPYCSYCLPLLMGAWSS